MDILRYVLGILAAVAALIAAIIVTIWCYLNYCSKHPMRKLRAEIFVVVFVGILSLAIRMVIGFAKLPHKELAGGVESVWHGILATVSGLTFDSPTDPSNYSAANGLTTCLYYGIIAYAGFVFLSVVTVGISYEFYSHIQTAFMRLRRRCTYYIFTSITKDSLVLAEDIKRHEQNKKGSSYVIIFFDDGDKSFSRKNPLHRRIMENGFYYFSEPRVTDKGETVCFLKRFKFKRRHFIKDDVGENRHRRFYVFALDDSGDYEGVNADVIFDDMKAALKTYIIKKRKRAYNALPTVLNYYVLTSGEVDYESYNRRSQELISNHLASLPNEVRWDKACKKPETKENKEVDYAEYIMSRFQVNVVNEATLCSHSLVLARRAHLNDLGVDAFWLDTEPDKLGAYRAAVIGFGMTGQHAMKELYTHTAKLVKQRNKYVPTQFIADIFDADMDKKSGLFAYKHPFFRCIKQTRKGILATDTVLTEAQSIGGNAMDILYSEFREKTQFKKTRKQAQSFIQSTMAFPVAVMHKENSFDYPFLAKEGGDTALDAVIGKGVRDFIIALGNDEKNIDMANLLIGSFRRLLLKSSLAGKKPRVPLSHITIYVNIIDERNKALLDWRWDKDEKQFTHPYRIDRQGNICDSPVLSVLPFGYREELYSYDTFVEDYRERVYNYGYNRRSDILEVEYADKTDEEKKAAKELAEEIYQGFKTKLTDNFNEYRNDEKAVEEWLRITQFARHSNRSALDFSINFYKYKQRLVSPLEPADTEYMMRLEHERWNRFSISHGWIYAKYFKHLNTNGMNKDEKGEKTGEEKKRHREVLQHNCLCPYDVMLSDSTKEYDKGNVELGLMNGIVFGKQTRVSLVGDSISTYVNAVPKAYPVYYDDATAEKNGIARVNDTWWRRVIDSMGGELCVNNSFSGSTVAGEDDTCASSAERCSGLGVSPDVILIYMGTNDRGAKKEIGMKEPGNSKKFYGAYRVMLKQLKKRYRKAKIVCGTLLNGELNTAEFRQPLYYKQDEEYNDAIRLAAKKARCILVDLARSGERYETLDYVHPTQKGHDTIAALWKKHLKNLI